LLAAHIGHVAAGALVLVRHDVDEWFAHAVVGDEFERGLIAGAREVGVGLLGVPHVRQRIPAVFAAHENARFDQAHLAQVQAVASKIAGRVVGSRDGRATAIRGVGQRVVESLREDRADRKIEGASAEYFAALPCGIQTVRNLCA
jgi:hypothetical protein